MTYLELDGNGLKVDEVAPGRSKDAATKSSHKAAGLGFHIGGLPTCLAYFCSSLSPRLLFLAPTRLI
jgi:hypothetical protein